MGYKELWMWYIAYGQAQGRTWDWDKWEFIEEESA